MGKFSYKKRKGTRKQSFKNRKRVKKGGGDDGNENTDAAAAAGASAQKEEEAAAGASAQKEEEAAATTTTTTTTSNTQSAVVDPNEAEKKEVTVDPNAEEKTGNEAETNDAAGNEAGNENPAQDWKDGQSEDAVKRAQQEVSDIEGKANDQGELDPKEINNLVNQLAEGKDVPLWAKALAKSGAVGTAAKILNKNPALRDALMKKGIDVINNADVSMAPGSASAPGAPDTNTGAAAPGGSYTADDAGYQKFIESVKTDPETLKNVVYVNDQMTQIFLKNPNGWTEIKK